MTPPTHRLTRSRRDRMICGVAAGLAEYFDVDPTLVRVVFVVAALLNGIGLLLYVILCFIVPSEEDLQSRPPTMAPGPPTVAEGDQAPMNEGNVSGTTAPAAAEPTAYETASMPHRPQRAERHTWAGIILILVGLVFLAQNTGLLWWWQWRIAWPIVLIAIGAILLARRLKA